MAWIERSVEVGVPRARFFAVVVGYEAYAEFLSGVRQIAVQRTGPEVAQVAYTLELDLGVARKRIRYTLVHRAEPPAQVHWRLLEGEILKENRGVWLLEELGEARTRATYRIDIGFGPLVPRSISDYLTERSLPKMLGEFKARAEALWASERS